ncbi:retrovirus-related pol polyprotein from transposon TNT 1-94 [Tanacetum coccineum]
MDLPHGKRAIGTKWVYRNKKDKRVARIEAIRLVLAYASFKDFVVYQMDVKSAFLYGKIEEEVYVCQPPGFEDLEFPDRVYKIDKTLFIKRVKSYILLVQVYVDDIIFGSTKKMLCTELEKLMVKKFQMSSMASTPMETSKPLLKDAEAEDVDVHLYRSIFGSLMYLTSSRPDIMFVVCACARFQVTPKVSHLHVMKRIFRYLKGHTKLGLWYPKDSPFDLEAFSDSDYAGAIANSTTEAEYVAAASCCGQVLWIQNQMLDYGYNFMNTKIFIDNESTICIVKNPFWATSRIKTVNGEVQIQALVDGKKVIVTETNVRRSLQLKDAKGTKFLPNATIFAELERMSANNTWNEFSSTMASAIICLATNQKFNFSKYILDNMVKNLKGGVKFLMYLRFVQVFLDKQVEGMTKHKEIYVTPSHTKKPQKKQPKRKQRKDTKVPQPSGSIEPITNEAANEEHVPVHSNDPLLSEITKLKEMVKKLERRNKLRTPGLKRLMKVGRSAQVVSSEDKEVTLVDEAQERNDDNLMFDIGVFDEQEVEVEKVVSTAKVTTASATTTTVDELTLAQTLKKSKQLNLRLARQKEEEGKLISWDNTQAMMEADYKLAQRLQVEEQDSFVPMDTEDEVAIDAIPLATKSPIIVDWKIIKEGKMGYFQIIRADGSSIRPEEAYERVLWGDLKVMFEPDVEALVDAYESDKLILDTYRDIVSFKRRRDDEDKDEEPSAGSNQGSKRRRAGKEPELTSALKEKTSKITGKSTEGSKSHHKSAQAEEPIHTAEDLEEPAHQEFVTRDTEDKPDEETSQHPDWFQKLAKPPTPDRDWNKTLIAAHGPVQPWLSTLDQKEDTRKSFNKLMDTPLDFSAFVKNRLKVETLTPELLVGLTFELMKGSCKSQQYPHDLRKPLPLIPNSRDRQVIPFYHFINNDLAYLCGGVSSRTYTTLMTKTKAADYGHIKWIEDLVPNRMWSQVRLATTNMHFGESHIGAENDNNSMDLLLTGNLLVMSTPNAESLLSQSFKLSNGIITSIWIRSLFVKMMTSCKLTNLTVEECLAFNVSWRISDLKQRDSYTAYSNPRGFIYQNKDKKNRLMCIDELHKFCDGTLNDVWTTLNDRLKGIRMKYLP